MKQQMRKTIMAKRNALSKQEIQAHSASVGERILPFLKGCVGTYAAIDSEIDVSSIRSVSSLTFALPKTYSNHTLRFFEVCEESDLIAGVYGILEPREGKECISIDVLIIPLVAFDEQCNRLGHGAGYYDRYLKTFQGCTIGVAHECQKVDQVLCEEHDIPLDMIVTEKKIYKRVVSI